MSQALYKVKSSRGLRAAGAVLAAAAMVSLTTMSLAQTPGGPNRPAPKKELKAPIPPAPTEPPSAPLQMIVAVGILAILVGVSLIPSKRGHQD